MFTIGTQNILKEKCGFCNEKTYWSEFLYITIPFQWQIQYTQQMLNLWHANTALQRY